MYYGWYFVIACSLISVYTSGTLYLGFTAAFEPIAREFGWSYTQISLAASLRGLETGLLVAVAGMLMDRWGPRKLVSSGAILSGLGLILLSQIQSLTMFYVSFVFIAAGLTTASTSLLMSAVAKWFRKRVGLAMGLAASGVPLGGLLLLLVTWVIDTCGWRQAMIIMGVGMWAIPLPLSFLLRHRPEKYGYLPDGEVQSPLADKEQTITTPSQEANFGAKAALASGTFWFIAVAFLFHGLPVSAVMTHIMPYFSSLGMARSTQSTIACAVPLVTIIGRIGFGWLGDRIDRRWVAFLAFLLTGLGALMLAFSAFGWLWPIPIFILAFGIGWGGGVPMLSGLLAGYFGRERLGTIIGLAGSFLMLGQLIGAPLAGWIFDTFGGYQRAWFLLAGVVSVASILFCFCRKIKLPQTQR
ncbi:MAG: MFS transporter [Deltaproteobacteria bacterium]|nr:MFS transporter [Deltaproteobacteria bacterium]